MSGEAALIALVGPTAVGKTAVSLGLAEALSAEIVSADSRLLYRGMDIGTAKPSVDEQARARHHLIDVADPRAPWSLAEYRAAALAAIADIHARGRLALLVGGTGQYVRAILEGWSPPPRPADDGIRRELEAVAAAAGPQMLHRRLAAVDPDSAARIDARNVRRVVRALEIHALTGQPASRQRRAAAPQFRVLRVGLTLPRTELYARIDARIDAMLAAGWMEEVRRLLALGLTPASPAMSAIGYATLAEHWMGSFGLEEAVRRIRRATRQFVRRQANWFKPDDLAITWFDSSAAVGVEIEAFLQDWLARPEAAG